MTETLVDTRPHHGGSSNEYQQHHDEHATTSATANGPLEAPHHSNISSTHRSVAAKLRPDANPASGDGADVGTVMNKAKKAAQSIWVLVHAQNCRIGGDRCPHKGCTEAKRVLLHIKMCPSGNSAGGTCSMNYNGCQQSRKLLAHNQKCREIRAKQAGMGRRTKNAHVCLVCSLVARHARNVLEGTSSRKLNAKKQAIASFTLVEPGPDVVSNTNGFMPPPPPRQRMGGSLPNTSMLSGSDSSSEDGPFESPLTRTNQLMLFSEVAAAAAAPTTSAPTNLAALGKSLDSSKSPFLTFAVSALQNLKKAPPTRLNNEEIIEQQPMSSPRRSRAESYDERAHKMTSPSSSRFQHRRHAHDGSDPTLELDLKGEEHFNVEEEVIVRRSRSASLGVLASACSVTRNGTCDTIVEEASLAREGELFAMDEDEPL